MEHLCDKCKNISKNSILNYIHDCNTCNQICDGKSKERSDFDEDEQLSKEKEKEIIKLINGKTNLFAEEAEYKSYPDIVIYSDKNKSYIVCYFEIKFQKRTFMAISRKLKNKSIIPSESLVLNLSDLLKYFELKKLEYNLRFRETYLWNCPEYIYDNHIKEPIYIGWILEDRPCINQKNKSLYFYQNIESLYNVYKQDGYGREYKRKENAGDINEKGEHKGVVMNYHISISELNIGFPPELNIQKCYLNKILKNSN